MSNEIISTLKCVRCNKEFDKRELSIINGNGTAVNVQLNLLTNLLKRKAKR